MERLNADIHDAQPSRTQGFMLPSARWARGILCTSVYYTLGKASEKKDFVLHSGLHSPTPIPIVNFALLLS